MRKKRKILRGAIEAPSRYEMRKALIAKGYEDSEFTVIETERGTYTACINGLIPDRNFIELMGGFIPTNEEKN